jgi:carbon-monoxide dehydrogenase large subunit
MPYNASTALPGPYILPAYDLRVSVVETNKVATSPVRGAGYPEGTFAMERVLDRIANELGFDRAEVRRRNLVPADNSRNRFRYSAKTYNFDSHGLSLHHI